MNRQDPTSKVRTAMQRDWTMESGQGYTHTILPLYWILTRLTDTDTIVYGDIDQNTDGQVTALLVTDKNIYHAQFQTREVDGSNGRPSGREVDGKYNLQVASRTRMKSITIDNMTANDHDGEPVRVDFTVDLDGFDFSIPVRYSRRNFDGEFGLLEELAKSLGAN